MRAEQQTINAEDEAVIVKSDHSGEVTMNQSNFLNSDLQQYIRY